MKHVEYLKATVRSKAEHPFRVIKHHFGYQKVCFKDLAKNIAQILAMFAFSNLWMMRRSLLASMGRCARDPVNPPGNVLEAPTPSNESLIADVWMSNERRLVRTIPGT